MRKVVLCIYVLFISVCLKAQDNPQVVPVSPEAAALSKMVNYPINHNTGVPNISIPFYEVSIGNLNLPIVLNYHAGGFKINEKATRVGLGWSLSCDLQITRSINGKDDLTNIGGYLVNSLLKSHNDNYNSSLSYPFYSTSTTFSYDNTYDLATGKKDGMPDKFNYKLLNKSGSFYFQKSSSGTSYTIVPVPYSNIKITYNSTDGTFEIVDTDGTTYSFGVAGSINTSNLHNIKKEATGTVITTWKCNTVTSNNKVDKMTFTYTLKPEEIHTSYNDKIEYFNNPNPCAIYPNPYYKSNESPLQGINDYHWLNLNPLPFYQLSSPKYWVSYWNKNELHIPYLDNQNNVIDKIITDTSQNSKSASSVRGVFLSEINLSRGGKVVFNGASQLESIEILDEKGSELKTLYLFQSLTKTSVNGSYTEGTRYLDSLHVRNGEKSYQKYDLLYTNKFDFGKHLVGHDVWGYCNQNTRSINQNDIGTTIPKQTIIQNRFYKDVNLIANGCTNFASDVEVSIGTDDNWAESANRDAIQRGILKRIIYPTGGAVDFDFESNRYLESFNGENHFQQLPQIGGGLRIRSINYLDKGSDVVKTQKYYRYGDLEEGTGLVLREPKKTPNPLEYYFGVESYDQNINYLQAYNPLIWDPNTNKYITQTCDDLSCINNITMEVKTTYRPTSSLDYTYPNGAPIYYTKVTEYQRDLGKYTGKKVYTYYEPSVFNPYSTEIPSLHENLVPNTPIKYLKTDWRLGAQKSIETYKYDETLHFKPVHKKSFEYTRYDRPNMVKVVYAFTKNIFTLVEGIYTGSYDLQRNYSQSSLNYEYGEYGIPMGKLLLTQEKEEFFEGEDILSITTNFYYDNESRGYLQPTRIETVNSLGDLIKTEPKYAYDFEGDSTYNQMVSKNMITQLVEEVKTNVTKNKELFRKKINYEYISEGLGFYAPKTIQSSVQGEVLKTDFTYSKYDQYGNILEFRGRNNIPISYLWGYNHMYPVAKLNNVVYANISSTFKNNTTIINPSSEEALLGVLSSLRNEYTNQNQMLNTYTYKRQVGVSSMTSPNDYTIYYEYDAIGRLLTQKDKNQKILKSYEYHVSDLRENRPLYYYDVPKMRSIDYDCNMGRVDNYIYQGGASVGTAHSAYPTLYNSLDNIANSVSNPFTNCTPTQTASLEFLYLFIHNEVFIDYPINIEVDFIQNGSIIATQRMIPNDFYNGTNYLKTNLLLNEGNYQISFRMDADVKYANGEFPDFSITVDNVKTYIKPGDTISLVNGKQYTIQVVTWHW